MSKWVDWSDPHLSRVADRVINNVRKIMSGDLSDGPAKPPQPLIKSGDYCKVHGPNFGVPRIYYGMVQSVTDYGFANLCIDRYEDPAEDPLLSGLVKQKIAQGRVLTSMDLATSAEQLFEEGEIMTLPVSCLQKVE